MEVVIQQEDRKDFFISYNRADQSWAEWIAWQLEEAGYTVVIQAWDFLAGSNFVLEMHKASSNAEHTIAMLSPDYLNALYPQPEWASAFVKDPTGEQGKLLPIRVRECKPPGLFTSIIYIDLVGMENEGATREKLLTAIHRQRAKPKSPPLFPGRQVDLQHTLARPSRFPGSLPEKWNIPYRRNIFFTGHENILERLHEALTTNKTAALTQPQAISGLGGIGKTQIAVEYAYRYHSDYEAVLWAQADSPEILTSEFVRLAFVLDLPEKENSEPRSVGIPRAGARLPKSPAPNQQELVYRRGRIEALEEAKEPPML